MHPFSSKDARVCSECFEDEDLKSYIEGNADEASNYCSFCGAEGDDVTVCAFVELMEHVKSCIESEYDLAANCLGWEGAEGGWQGAEYWDTPDLLKPSHQSLTSRCCHPKTTYN
jgi:hypothetical protein